MRGSRCNAPLKPAPTHALRASLPIADDQPCGPDLGHDNGIVGAVKLLADAVKRLAEAIEKQNSRLGDGDRSRYTRSSEPSGLVDEKAMGTILNIRPRTLGNHRRQGRLPNCWVRNAGRISWKVSETQEAWERGIA